MNKMKKTMLILAIIVIPGVLRAQNFEKQNSILVETNFIATATLSYDRILPLSEKMAVMLGGNYIMGVGFGGGSHWLGPEANVLIFGPIHFFEAGVMYAWNFNAGNEEEGDSDSSPGFRLAYRWQGKKGFIMRASANFLVNADPVFFPEVGIGYLF